jgi:glycosyltransferase involved in cell wall biosynthesis
MLAPLRRWKFEQLVARQLHLRGPQLVIAYEPAAIATVGRLASRAGSEPFIKVWHFHEYPRPAAGLRWGSRKDLEWSLQNVGAAQITVFPDRHRAERFAREMEQTIKPVVVMNCPRRLEPAPKPALGKLLQAKGYPPSAQAVLYVGAVGETHGLETAMRSMVHWPPQTMLVLVGSAAAGFKTRLLNEAAGLGVSQRIIFPGIVDPKNIWGIRVGATVALTTMEPIGVNRLLSAGASNKRFEAMAAGVPQVSDRNPGVPELVEQTGSGLCVPHDDAEALGRAVAKLLNDEPLRRQMGAQARRMHLERFNYETEFQPVLEQLLESVKRRRWVGGAVCR